MSEVTSTIQVLLEQNRTDLLEGWLRAQLAVPGLRTDLISQDELRIESERFLRVLQEAISRDASNRDVTSPQWASVREFLMEISQTRATRGFTPTETATF